MVDLLLLAPVAVFVVIVAGLLAMVHVGSG